MPAPKVKKNGKPRQLSRPVVCDEINNGPILLNFVGWRPDEVERECKRLVRSTWTLTPRDLRELHEAVNPRKVLYLISDHEAHSSISHALLIGPHALLTDQLDFVYERCNQYIHTASHKGGHISEAVVRLSNVIQRILGRKEEEAKAPKEEEE